MLFFFIQVSFAGMEFDLTDTGGLEDGADQPWKGPPGTRKPLSSPYFQVQGNPFHLPIFGLKETLSIP